MAGIIQQKSAALQNNVLQKFLFMKVSSSCNHYLKAFVVKLTRSNLPLLQTDVFTFGLIENRL